MPIPQSLFFFFGYFVPKKGKEGVFSLLGGTHIPLPPSYGGFRDWIKQFNHRQKQLWLRRVHYLRFICSLDVVIQSSDRTQATSRFRESNGPPSSYQDKRSWKEKVMIPSLLLINLISSAWISDALLALTRAKFDRQLLQAEVVTNA